MQGPADAAAKQLEMDRHAQAMVALCARWGAVNDELGELATTTDIDTESDVQAPVAVTKRRPKSPSKHRREAAAAAKARAAHRRAVVMAGRCRSRSRPSVPVTAT